MPKKIVIIGAVALGPKAACRFKRLDPDAKVTMIDQDNLISYGGCGIPYFISGDVSDPGQLQTTSFHMLRDKSFFSNAKGVEVLTRTKALAIDRKNKQVFIKNLDTQEKDTLFYDKLVLATGSRPRRLDIPGIHLDCVYSVSGMHAAIAIKERITTGKVGNALIIGGGFIGLEMAEALTDMWGIETTVVEITNQILPNIISKNMAKMAQNHMEENGVSFFLKERIERLEGKDRVTRAVTNKRTIETDLVVVSVGIKPNSELADKAGLKISKSGAIVVNKKLQTSDPDIYAGGDVVEVNHLITGRSGYYPLGSMANRQGRIIGTNLAGGNVEFPGAVGSFVVKLFDISVSAVGLSIEVAQQEGFDAVSAMIAQFDRAHFYPEKDLMYLELVVERETEKVLGIQGIGNTGDGTTSRINAVAAILPYQPTLHDISNLELAYSPPFSSAMDILNALGNTAENLLNEKNRVLNVDEFEKLWKQAHEGETAFLDCRGWGNAKPFVERYPEKWQSLPQDQLLARIDEVPKDKRIVLICNTGVRSYEAQITLKQQGIRNTANLQGGMACVKKWGMDI
ncbi:MAG: FAD-dependent oxidoreductase [Desulfobacterales bacterium]|nr:MAG: FAD-dependent oxidoreductase [Desulfobacterales bacterium]